MSVPTRDDYDDIDDVKDRGDSVASPTTIEGARIEETIYNAELKAAIENTKLDPWSRRAISLYFICMVGFLNAVSSGTHMDRCRTRSHLTPHLLAQVSMARSWAGSTPWTNTSTFSTTILLERVPVLVRIVLSQWPRSCTYILTSYVRLSSLPDLCGR